MKNPLLMLGLSGKIYHVLASLEDALVKQYDAKLLTRIKQDSSAKFSTSKELVDHIVSFDPTGKSYKRWLVVTYLNKGIAKVEDLYKAKESLTLFEKYKSKIVNKDINSYKTLQDLFKVTDPLDINSKNVDKDSISDKEKENLFYKKKQAILIHNSAKFKIVQPKTKEASQFFGRNTKWCTAAKNSDNMFADYKHDYNLFYILDKANNKRWAIASPKLFKDDQQLETEAFDERDNRILPAKVFDIDPEIKNALLPLQSLSYLCENDLPISGKNKETLDKIQKKLSDSIKRRGYSRIDSPFVNRQDLEYLVNLVTEKKLSQKVVKRLCCNPLLDSSMIKKLLKTNLSIYAKIKLARNSKIDSEIAKKLISTKNKDIQYSIACNKSTRADILLLLLKSNNNNDVVIQAFYHPNMPSHVMEKYLKTSNPSYYVMESIFYNPNIPYDIIKKYGFKFGSQAIICLTTHRDFKMADLKPTIDKLSIKERIQLVKNFNNNDAVIDILLKDKNVRVRIEAAYRIKYTTSNIEKYVDIILADPSEEVRLSLNVMDLDDDIPQKTLTDIVIRLLQDPSNKVKREVLYSWHDKNIPKSEIEKVYNQSRDVEIKKSCLTWDVWNLQDYINFFQQEQDVRMLSYIINMNAKIPADIVVEKLPLLMKKPSITVDLLMYKPRSFLDNKVVQYIFENSKDKTTRTIIEKTYKKYLPVTTAKERKRR